MQYRIVSIENPAEVHVHDGQLIVMQDKGTATVPLRGISIIVVCGPNIRISTLFFRRPLTRRRSRNTEIVTTRLGARRIQLAYVQN